MGVNVNVRIFCVCVVLFMAIEAMGVHITAPMDQFSGTFLLCICYFIFWFALMFFLEIAVFVLVLLCSHVDMGVRTLGKPKNKYKNGYIVVYTF